MCVCGGEGRNGGVAIVITGEEEERERGYDYHGATIAGMNAERTAGRAK